MPTFPHEAAPQALVIGCIKRRRAGSANTPRWALYWAASPTHPERLSNTFAADLHRDGLAALLAQSGMVLRADNTVVSIPGPRLGVSAPNLCPSQIADARRVAA